MVDAGAAVGSGLSPSIGASERLSARGREAVVQSGSRAVETYCDACHGALLAPHQDPLWIESWTASGTVDLVSAVLHEDGWPVMALALEVEARAGFRIARFVGGSHANGNFPATSGRSGGGEWAEALIAAIRTARPDIDLLALERQVEALDGSANPLASLPHRPSPNIALSADLAGGFEALLDRVNGKRKRKKYRSQLRKFEEAGGFRRIRATTTDEVDRLLGAFYAMRSERFAAQGISDVFTGEVRDAFRRLYAGALASARPRFFLDALEVGGTIRAVTGSSLSKDRVICDFCAFSNDDLTAASPGEFLFFENIREACEQGVAIYDFSVGEERYKRAWCDIETVQFDTFVPLTLKGRAMVAGLSATSALKRTIKNNQRLWGLAKSLRGTRATAAANSPSEGD